MERHFRHTFFDSAAVARGAFTVLLSALALHAGPARADDAGDAAPVPGDAPVLVRIERVRPPSEKLTTLRFLKENRDFIRGRFDLLRQRPIAGHGETTAVDPRFLAYQSMLADVLGARDSVASAEERRSRLTLLASVTQLGDLESELDGMERLLAAQRDRLSVLQADFTGRQQTALAVVITGDPAALPLSEISVTVEGGARITVTLGEAERAILKRGGAVQVFRGFVEPRAQTLEIGIGGAAWPAGDTGYVALEPPRDRLTMLRLDLSTLDAARGAPSIRASTWLYDARIPSSDG
jgi:hypothetical protein